MVSVMTSNVPTTSIPYNGSGTINIHINNPTASVGGGMPGVVPMPCYPMPYPYPCYTYPPNYYINNLNNFAAGQWAPVPGMQTVPTQNGLSSVGGVVQNPQQNLQESSLLKSSVATQNVSSGSGKQRQIVVLTDNYVKNLENYLRNPNSELRKTATSELLKRFKEDKTRISNPSLTALLNIALQDNNATVRAIAMSILSSGYAKGDGLTEKILKELQKSKSNYSADAMQAADSLLKMSETKVLVPDNSHYTYQNTNNNKKGK